MEQEMRLLINGLSVDEFIETKMDITKEPKTRIEFETIDQAKKHRDFQGGWIVVHENGRIYHYSFRYSRSEIFADLSGTFSIL